MLYFLSGRHSQLRLPLRSVIRNSLCALLMLPLTATSQPWINAEDDFLRTSISVLADAGIITSPINVYPLPWSDIKDSLAQVDVSQLTDGQALAYHYVNQHLKAEGGWQHELMAFTGTDVFDTQSFGMRMDSQTGLRVTAQYQGDGWAAGARMNVRDNNYNPEQDDNRVIWDGSYLAKQLGNWWVSVDQMTQYWGPAQTNATLISNNARPMPAVRVTRDSAEAFEIPVLSWLGPWRMTTFLGQQEASNQLPKIKVWGMRVNFMPHPSLEIGLSRAAQWGGEGRNESFSMFLDMLAGLDNSDEIDSDATEAGNQLAGGDIRWSTRFAGHPVAVYGEFIGEDEAGGLPSHFFYLSGIETHFLYQQQLAKVFYEYTDTTVDCSWPEMGSTFPYNCGYNNGIMKEGYRRYGRSMGSTYDNDTIAHTFGAKVIGDKAQWYTNISHIRLNVDDTGYHPLAPNMEERLQWDIGYQQPAYYGTVLVEGRVAERTVDGEWDKELFSDLRFSWRYQW